MDILGPSTIDVDRVRRWAAARSCTVEFAGVLPLYWRYAPERGVRPEVAAVQFAKETGFGRFGRAVTPAHRNPCGLKVRARTRTPGSRRGTSV